MLDIGGDVGAIVLHVPAAFADEELEIRRLDPSGPRTHTAVRERRVGRTSAYAAVYPRRSRPAPTGSTAWGAASS